MPYFDDNHIVHGCACAFCRGDKNSHERKPTHGAGRTHKKKCIAKRGGGRCPCGCYGKKLIHIPFPYKDNEIVVMRSRKWQKKHGIELIKQAKEMFQ
jgi:hypothetical protein